MDALNNREGNHSDNSIRAPAPSDKVILSLGWCHVDAQNGHVYDYSYNDRDRAELHRELY